MNNFFKFFVASNRYKHLTGGFIVAALAGSFYAAVYAAVVAARVSNSKTDSTETPGTGSTGSAHFSAVSLPL
jgi:hypothetical protein